VTRCASFISQHDGRVELDSLEWPRDLHVVTVTPDFSLETKLMREIMTGKSVSIFDAADANRRRAEVLIGVAKRDAERIIRFSNESIIENVRWSQILSSDRHAGNARVITFAA
jgi:homoserine kinase